MAWAWELCDALVVVLSVARCCCAVGIYLLGVASYTHWASTQKKKSSRNGRLACACMRVYRSLRSCSSKVCECECAVRTEIQTLGYRMQLGMSSVSRSSVTRIVRSIAFAFSRIIFRYTKNSIFSLCLRPFVQFIVAVIGFGFFFYLFFFFRSLIPYLRTQKKESWRTAYVFFKFFLYQVCVRGEFIFDFTFFFFDIFKIVHFENHVDRWFMIGRNTVFYFIFSLFGWYRDPDLLSARLVEIAKTRRINCEPRFICSFWVKRKRYGKEKEEEDDDNDGEVVIRRNRRHIYKYNTSTNILRDKK